MPRYRVTIEFDRTLTEHKPLSKLRKDGYIFSDERLCGFREALIRPVLDWFGSYGAAEHLKIISIAEVKHEPERVIPATTTVVAVEDIKL